MQAIPYDKRLSTDVTGRMVIDEDRLEKKLGETAYLLWQILCANRSAKGFTTITYAGIRRAKQFNDLTDRQIKRSLIRLRKAGLVRDLYRRRQKLRLPKGRNGDTVMAWAMPRQVFGARAASVRGSVVVVPNRTRQWVKSAPGRGGRRAGAGRKQKNQRGPYVKIGNQRGPYASFSNGSTDLLYTKQCSIDLKDDVACLATLGRQHGRASATVDPLLSIPSAGGKSSHSLESHDPETGSRLGPTTRTLAPPAAGTQGMPPYPAARIVPPAMIPPPPRLPEELTDTEGARWLVNAFRGAVESRYKKLGKRGKPYRCWVLSRRGSLEKSKYLKQLIEAADLLRELEAAPAAWCAFSVDCWRKYDMGKKPPSIAWVYQLGRIENQNGWYQGEEPYYMSRRVVYSKPAQVLIYQYQQMRFALARSGAQTRQEVAVVVEKFFPDGLYDRLVDKAKDRSLDDQQRISAAAARGEWQR